MKQTKACQFAAFRLKELLDSKYKTSIRNEINQQQPITLLPTQRMPRHSHRPIPIATLCHIPQILLFTAAFSQIFGGDNDRFGRCGVYFDGVVLD
jgi:hypothetical protein